MKDIVKIVSSIIGLLVALYALNSYIESIVERKINDINFVNKIAEKIRRPVVIFDQRGSIIVDNDAMRFIDNIEVILENKEPKQIIISPNRHFNIAPILESLDDDYIIEAKRGKKFDWIYELGVSSYYTDGSAKQLELKRFRLEIIP